MFDLTYAVVGKVELCFEKDIPMEITMGKNLPIFLLEGSHHKFTTGNVKTQPYFKGRLFFCLVICNCTIGCQEQRSYTGCIF